MEDSGLRGWRKEWRRRRSRRIMRKMQRGLMMKKSERT